MGIGQWGTGTRTVVWDVGVTAAPTVVCSYPGEWEVSHLLLPPEQGLKISSS